METVQVPTCIPGKHKKRFSAAEIAINSGQELAAAFLLRVFIEQFWRSQESVKQHISKKSRPTGEEMGSIYKKELPEDFRERFPTLLPEYEDLSAVIHSGQGDSAVYIGVCEKVVEHFRARELFKLLN